MDKRQEAENLLKEYNQEHIIKYLNKMDDETFELFMQYHLSTCERQDMIGASSHTLDILRKV